VIRVWIRGDFNEGDAFATNQFVAAIDCLTPLCYHQACAQFRVDESGEDIGSVDSRDSGRGYFSADTKYRPSMQTVHFLSKAQNKTMKTEILRTRLTAKLTNTTPTMGK
jgi:hypothetical protein